MVTKTLGPLHFEDLEPHRFEDLVRNLLYDFRDWQSLEPTGRGGADDGYDARGWERVPLGQRQEPESEEEPEEAVPHTAETRAWMVQCKREKSLGPADVRKIIADTVSAADPPYGFVLVAPVSFSKKSYDAFRESLRERGVSEFYLWGKAEIEDMLLLPKNDRILFAFMGISLATRRRSRTTDVRAAITVKNKLARALSDGSFDGEVNRSILVRDINDETYPAEDVGAPGDGTPWQEHLVKALYPNGLLVEARKHYAYVDETNRRYDLCATFDLVNRESDSDEKRRETWEQERKVRDFHEHLPKRHRGMFSHYALIPYRDILLVDDKGDGEYGFPHVYVDMERGKGVESRYGPFGGSAPVIVADNGQSFDLRVLGYERTPFFPEVFPEIPPHVRIRDRKLEVGREVQWKLKSESAHIFDCDGKWGPLAPREVIEVENPLVGRNEDPFWLEVVDVAELKARDCVELHRIESLEKLGEALGKKVKAGEKVRAVEVRRIHEYSIKEG